MDSVTPMELTRRILQTLGIRDGEAIDLSRLRDGSVLLKKAEATEEAKP